MRPVAFVCMFLAALGAGLSPPLGAAPGGGVSATKHNLSASGPGTARATSETRICNFCHAPHNASPSAPLWNRRAAGSTYTPYTSSSARAGGGQPTGASLNCLSCHDGTIALGELLNRTAPVAMSGGVTTMPEGTGKLGTDLSDDHPVSIVYNAALVAASGGELADPATLTGKVRLDASGRLQCTSCHDPHDDSQGNFLVMSNHASALCQTCHRKNYWNNSSHKLSGATWNGAGADPWPHTPGTTVAGNACENCHRPHSGGGAAWLLNSAAEEDNCKPCHNGNVAAKNVQAEFNKVSIHPVALATGVHDVSEAALVARRHVECVDCHNPHASNTSAGALPGSLVGVSGITIGGVAVMPAVAEYQICLRCHGDSPGKPAPKTTRQISQGNVRLEFDTANPSYHPVAGPGKGGSVPSLVAPWTTASVIKCSDCHNNNAGPAAGGSGPNGPHGSSYPSLLERRYATADYTTESSSAYALCYKCHSRSVLLYSGTSVANEVHKEHVVSQRTPCNVCHDPHGVNASQGNSTNNSRLINFDTAIVKPNSSGILKWVKTGTGKGSCYMRCHGDDHNPETY